MKASGIHWETTSSHMPEQNGTAECLNQSIVDHICTILIDVGAPLFLWAKAANYVVYMRNCQPMCALTNTTPFEQRFGTKPDITGSHRFGCMAYVYNTATQHKLDLRAKQAIFVSYADTQKAW